MRKFLNVSHFGVKKRAGTFRYKYICRMSKQIWVVVSNIFYFHPDPWGNDPI